MVEMILDTAHLNSIVIYLGQVDKFSFLFNSLETESRCTTISSTTQKVLKCRG